MFVLIGKSRTPSPPPFSPVFTVRSLQSCTVSPNARCGFRRSQRDSITTCCTGSRFMQMKRRPKSSNAMPYCDFPSTVSKSPVFGFQRRSPVIFTAGFSGCSGEVIVPATSPAAK